MFEKPNPTFPLKRFMGFGFFMLASLVLSGCASVNKFSQGVANSVSYEDKVTGARTLGLMSEEQEIKAGTDAQATIIEGFKKQGVAVDNDPPLLEKLQKILKSITEVSHRPNLPWEVHLADTKIMNAFALPGGKVFVLKGLFGGLVDNDDELAGVIAHEVAHVTCRHQVESQAWTTIMPMIEKRSKNEMYKACYSTLHEDEADRVGLLYMSLAGYNPKVVSEVWKRADQKYGSGPGSYLYDHSLNAERAVKVDAIIPIAQKYYVAEGVKNPDYTKYLSENDLIKRTGLGNKSGLASLLDLSLNTFVKYSETRGEQLNRENSARREQYLKFAKLDNVIKTPTNDGHMGVFADLSNTSNMMMKTTEITIYYLDSGNKVLYSEKQSITGLASNQKIKCGFYLKDVQNSANIQMSVTNVEY